MAKFVRADVHINGAGSAIEVEMICGFAHHMRYRAELFDDQGNNPQTESIGSTLQTNPPPFAISVVPPQLVGRFLMITADLFHMGTTDNFQVEAVFSQNNAQIGHLILTGTFQDNTSVALIGRFQ